MTSTKLKKANNTPRVSVLMPVYNGEKYLKEAIGSILNQSFADFEFLIVNDGSTDGTKKIIKSYNDPRIRLVNNEKNLNLANSLNKGIDLARGEYIVRMDADDISLPDRLEVQVSFMDKNTEIGIAGSWIKIFGENIKSVVKTYPLETEKIKALLLFKNAVSHPTIIIRKKVFNEHNLRYDKNLNSSQDYELWARAIKYFPIVNIGEVLLLYRAHNKGITGARMSEQRENSTKIKLKQLLNLEVVPDNDELSVFKTNYKPDNYGGADFLNKKGQFFLKLIKQNNKIKYYKEPEFSETISRIWFNACAANMDPAFKLWKIFRKFPFQKGLVFQDYKFILKCFLNCVFKDIKHLVKIILKKFSGILEYFSNIKAEKIMGKIDIKSDKEKGITIIILSFNRINSLKKLLRSLLQQKLNNINLEIIICNNYEKINLKKSKLTSVGRLLRQFSNLKILNSSYNWRTDIRYSLATISKYETILFVDDDIFFKDNYFIQYMYDKFKTLRDVDILSCWNTIWTEYHNNDHFRFTRVNFSGPDSSTELVETDTCGMGICMFNKKILYRQEVFEKSQKYYHADDMSFPVILNMDIGGKNYYLPSFGKLAFHRSSKKLSLCKVKEHYINLFPQYKKLYKDGYIPVIKRNSKSKEYARGKKTKKYLW